MTDWPGDTAPLPHQTREDRLTARLARMVGAPWYICPRCQRSAPWTGGTSIDAGDERDEFWCQTCGTETPLEECEVAS